MGIKGLWPYLSKKAAEAYADVGNLARHAGETWGVDVSLFMHRLGYDTPDEAPIDAFLEQAAQLRDAGITPIYVFDGKRHPAKRFEHVRRRDQTAKMIANSKSRGAFLAQLEQAASAVGEALPPPPPEPERVTVELDDGSVVERVAAVPKPPPLHADVAARVRELAASADAPPDLRRAMQRGPVVEIAGLGELEVEVETHVVVQDIQRRYAREQSLRDKGSTKVPDSHYHALMRAFDHHNIGYYIADGEAEQLGAELLRRGVLTTLVTDDGDALAFGATRVLRNLFREGKDGMQFVDLDRVLATLGLTHPQFIDVCIMSGSDFTESPGIPTIGMVNAVALVKKHGSLQQYLASPAWPVKLAAIQRSAKFPDWDPATFQHAEARATFLRRGDDTMIAYTSKAIDPAAKPIPTMERHGELGAAAAAAAAAGAAVVEEEVMVAGIVFEARAGGKRVRKTSITVDYTREEKRARPATPDAPPPDPALAF